jgi:tRNA(His) 5'-end guanylyltransferase
MEAFYPLLEELDITVAGEWEVLIGDGPHIICEGRAEKIDTLVSNLQGKKFRKIKQKLKQFIYHYESRILTFHIHKVLGYKSAYYNLISD